MPTALELLSAPDHGLVREMRASQVQMASSIQEVIDNGGVYFAEGPVGIGKGFAYLTPAIMASGRRVVVATAKKGLQDQLFNKDIPHIARAIGPAEMPKFQTGPEGERLLLASVVKGKGNYACRLLAEKHRPDVSYQDFLRKSRHGDRADFVGAPPAWWPSATAEDCIGRGCKYHDVCGYTRLKSEVKQSRIMVINHHLLGADMFYGHGKMVGGPFDILIIDEAHKLADGVRAAFTVKITENALTDLATALGNTSSVFNEPRRLMPLWEQMFQALPNRHWRDAHLRDIPVFPAHADEAIHGLEEIDLELAKTLGLYGIKGDAGSSEFWDALAAANVPDDVKGELAIMAQSRRKVGQWTEGIRKLQGSIKPMEEEEPEHYEMRKERILANTVAYGNADRRGRFHVNCAPVSLGGIAKSYFATIKSVVVTSATLAIGKSFTHLDDVVGVSPTKCEVLPTTFDYQKQGFLYVPKDVPYRARSAPDYLESVQKRVARAIRLVELSQGGAFILTTANDELDEFAIALKKRFPGKVFAQGHAKNDWDGEPQSILNQYLSTPNAVLVGSKSFWEGVDVAGEQLRLVIIAKLPFPMFNDPIVKARERAAGPDAFARVQMVDMLTDLRQGAGRLIRSKLDRGVVAILDERVWTKPYGKQVRSILQFPVVSDLQTCEKYLPLFVQYFQRLAQKGPNGHPAQPV